MKLYAAEVDDPDQPRGVVDDNLFRNAAGREGQGHGAQPIRPVGWGALLIKDIPFRAIYEAFENDGAVPNSPQGPFCDGQVISGDLKLRELGLSGEVGLGGMSDPDLTALDR